jgi:hypothetical protein
VGKGLDKRRGDVMFGGAYHIAALRSGDGCGIPRRACLEGKPAGGVLGDLGKLPRLGPRGRDDRPRLGAHQRNWEEER